MKVEIVDTTLRDGQQSLWATSMRTEAMLPTLPDLDRAGFRAIEFFVPSAQFRRGLRDLHEDPWVWIKAGAAMSEETPFRLHGAGGSPFNPVPLVVQIRLLEILRENGIRFTRLSDPWNNAQRLRTLVQRFNSVGFDVIVNLVYARSPRHTMEYYKRKIEEFSALDRYGVCIKDVGGILTPDVTKDLADAVLQRFPATEVEFHGHSNSGLAAYCAMVAVEAGVRIVHTAIPPLANGSSLPSVSQFTTNLVSAGYAHRLDMGLVKRVSQHLYNVALVDHHDVGQVNDYDASLGRHSIPGGMVSNLRYQLAEMGMENRLDEAVEETARVRAELGYPIMVTPLSQFVGSQAALNVIASERYGSVTDEVIQYALGMWGDEATELMDEDIRDRVLGRKRTDELIAFQRKRSDEEPSEFQEARSSFPSEMTDEEVIARYYAGLGVRDDLDLIHTREDVTYRSYLNRIPPITRIVREMERHSVEKVHVSVDGWNLEIER